MYVCMYVCMYVRTYVCMYVCMYVCIYIIYIYIYIYIMFPHFIGSHVGLGLVAACGAAAAPRHGAVRKGAAKDLGAIFCFFCAGFLVLYGPS